MTAFFFVAPQVLLLRLFLFNRVSNNLRNVLNLEFLFRLYALDSILEHRDAEGAGSGQHLGIGLQRLVDASLIDALTDLLLHPGATTTAAAAEALVTVSAHLCDSIAVQHVQYVP